MKGEKQPGLTGSVLLLFLCLILGCARTYLCLAIKK